MHAALQAANRMIDEGDDTQTLDSLLLLYDGLSDKETLHVPQDLQQHILAGRTRAKALFEWF